MAMIDNLIMPDYSNGKIYKLVSQSGLVKIGSTTLSLNYRLSIHKYHHKQWKAEKHHFLTSFKVFDDADCVIELLERYPCDNRNELELRERHYIEANKCVNKNVPTRGNQESCKQYRETHKAVINTKQNIKHSCGCGGQYTTANKQIHFKTNKHKQFLESL